MRRSSYKRIMDRLDQEYKSCRFKWDCENCDRMLCLRIAAIAGFPTIHGHFNLIAFINNKDKKDHVMVAKGAVGQGEDILTRLHSSCVTGDALGSLRCDCGPQLTKSLEMIEKEGLGILLYMQQEGRGIGLTNKIGAYMLQDEGSGTYETNIALGFQPDERQYELAAAMLSKLGARSIRLPINNPKKIKQLKNFDAIVNRESHLSHVQTSTTDVICRRNKNASGTFFRRLSSQ